MIRRNTLLAPGCIILIGLITFPSFAYSRSLAELKSQLRIQIQNGKKDAAQKNLVALRAAKDPEYGFYRGLLLLKEKKHQEAAESFESVKDLEGIVGVSAFLAHASCRAHLGEPSRAADLINQAFSRSEDSTKRLVIQHRTRLSQNFTREALRALDLKDWTRAEIYSDAVIEMQQAPSAFLLRGLIHLEQKEVAFAERRFRRVIALEPKGPNRDRAVELIRQVQLGIWTQRDHLALAFEGLGGYRTNLFANGFSEEGQTSRAVAQFQAQVRWMFFLREKSRFYLHYDAFWEEVRDLSSARYLTQNVGLLGGFTRGAWDLEVGFNSSLDRLGSNWIFWIPRLTLQLRRFLGRFEIGARTAHSKTLSLQTDFDYFRGTIHEAEIFAGYMTSVFYVSPFLNAIAYQVGDFHSGGSTLPIAFGGYGGGARVWFSLLGHFETLARFFYLHKSYTNLAWPGDEERVDQQWGAWLDFSYWLGGGLWAKLRGGATHNDSTLGAESVDDKNFTQYSILGGIRWEILP